MLISRLRALLCDACGEPRLRTVPGGYGLDVRPSELDAGRFEDDVAEARKAVALGRLTEGFERFRQGVAECRGSAFGDVHREALPALEALVAENPLRERPQALLMLALYRCGRHAEALEVYRHAHHLLATEQGLEPGLALRRIELEILRQEPSLSLLDHGYEWREAVATC